MAISKETVTNGKMRPILHKGTGQSTCLEVKIGSLGLEIWHFSNEEAHPYARLIFESDQGLIMSLNDNAAEGRANVSAKSDWQQGVLTHSDRQHSRRLLYSLDDEGENVECKKSDFIKGDVIITEFLDWPVFE